MTLVKMLFFAVVYVMAAVAGFALLNLFAALVLQLGALSFVAGLLGAVGAVWVARAFLRDDFAL